MINWIKETKKLANDTLTLDKTKDLAQKVKNTVAQLPKTATNKFKQLKQQFNSNRNNDSNSNKEAGMSKQQFEMHDEEFKKEAPLTIKSTNEFLESVQEHLKSVIENNEQQQRELSNERQKTSAPRKEKIDNELKTLKESATRLTESKKTAANLQATLTVLGKPLINAEGEKISSSRNTIIEQFERISKFIESSEIVELKTKQDEFEQIKSNFATLTKTKDTHMNTINNDTQTTETTTPAPTTAEPATPAPTTAEPTTATTFDTATPAPVTTDKSVATKEELELEEAVRIQQETELQERNSARVRNLQSRVETLENATTQALVETPAVTTPFETTPDTVTTTVENNTPATTTLDTTTVVTPANPFEVTTSAPVTTTVENKTPATTTSAPVTTGPVINPNLSLHKVTIAPGILKDRTHVFVFATKTSEKECTLDIQYDPEYAKTFATLGSDKRFTADSFDKLEDQMIKDGFEVINLTTSYSYRKTQDAEKKAPAVVNNTTSAPVTTTAPAAVSSTPAKPEEKASAAVSSTTVPAATAKPVVPVPAATAKPVVPVPAATAKPVVPVPSAPAKPEEKASAAVSSTTVPAATAKPEEQADQEAANQKQPKSKKNILIGAAVTVLFAGVATALLLSGVAQLAIAAYIVFGLAGLAAAGTVKAVHTAFKNDGDAKVITSPNGENRITVPAQTLRTDNAKKVKERQNNKNNDEVKQVSLN